MNKNAVGVAQRVRSKKAAVVLGIVIVLVAVAAILLLNREPAPPKTYGDPRLEETLGKTPPEDVEQKIRFYSTMGQAYVDTMHYEEACDAFLKADSFITDRSATAPVSENLGLYQCYAGLSDNDKARSYLEKEINRVKTNPNNAEYVKSLQAREQKL